MEVGRIYEHVSNLTLLTHREMTKNHKNATMWALKLSNMRTSLPGTTKPS